MADFSSFLGANPLIATQADKQKIQAAIDYTKGRRGNSPSRTPHEGPPEKSPDLIIALAPVGISALEALTGTGSGGDSVPSAYCEIYYIYEDGDTLEVLSGPTEKVYNISTTAIPADTYFPVSRLDQGLYLALFSASTTGRRHKAQCVDNIPAGGSGQFTFLSGPRMGETEAGYYNHITTRIQLDPLDKIIVEMFEGETVWTITDHGCELGTGTGT